MCHNRNSPTTSSTQSTSDTSPQSVETSAEEVLAQFTFPDEVPKISEEKSELKLDENTTWTTTPTVTLPPSPESNLEFDSEVKSSISQLNDSIVERIHDIFVIEKKDASTQTDIVLQQFSILPTTTMLSSITGTSEWNTGSLPHENVENQSSGVYSGDIENSDRVLDTPDHTALNHNMTFMNDDKLTAFGSDLNQWRDTDYNEEESKTHQNPCPCCLPNEQDGLSPTHWYQPPVPVPNVQSNAPVQVLGAQPPPPPPPSTTPTPAYLYYPPYGNNGMYYNNRPMCYYPNNYSQGCCNDNERPSWWNMNGRRWPESRDDFCSYGCGRRRRCRREFYVEAPRPVPRLPVKKFTEETTETKSPTQSTTSESTTTVEEINDNLSNSSTTNLAPVEATNMVLASCEDKIVESSSKQENEKISSV